MADQTIQYTEEMVGAGHPTKADTLNRHGLVAHNNDGTHKFITDNTNSTSLSTGALVTAGGAAVAKNLNVGGAINELSYTQVVPSEPMALQSTTSKYIDISGGANDVYIYSMGTGVPGTSRILRIKQNMYLWHDVALRAGYIYLPNRISYVRLTTGDTVTIVCNRSSMWEVINITKALDSQLTMVTDFPYVAEPYAGFTISGGNTRLISPSLDVVVPASISTERGRVYRSIKIPNGTYVDIPTAATNGFVFVKVDSDGVVTLNYRSGVFYWGDDSTGISPTVNDMMYQCNDTNNTLYDYATGSPVAITGFPIIHVIGSGGLISTAELVNNYRGYVAGPYPMSDITSSVVKSITLPFLGYPMYLGAPMFTAEVFFKNKSGGVLSGYADGASAPVPMGVSATTASAGIGAMVVPSITTNRHTLNVFCGAAIYIQPSPGATPVNIYGSANWEFGVVIRRAK